MIKDRINYINTLLNVGIDDEERIKEEALNNMEIVARLANKDHHKRKTFGIAFGYEQMSVGVNKENAHDYSFSLNGVEVLRYDTTLGAVKVPYMSDEWTSFPEMEECINTFLEHHPQDKKVEEDDLEAFKAALFLHALKKLAN